MFHRLFTIACLAIAALQAQPAVAAPDAPEVDCWIENLTPSVQHGAWADYVVHMSGGYGTYSVTFSYGDGFQDQGTYSASSASFSHVFATPNTYFQSARVVGAGSEKTCSTSTSVY